MARSRVLAAVLFLLASAAAPVQAAEVVKGPYLIFGGTPSEMTLRWQTDGDAAASTLEFGSDMTLGSGPHDVAAQDDHLHTFTLTGLEPGERYHYRVTVDGRAHEGTFRAAPSAEASRATLYAYGDSRSRPRRQQDVQRRILSDMDEAPDLRQTLCLHTGDWVFNGNSEAHWQRQHFNRSLPDTLRFHRELPLMGARGNHELGGGLLRKYYPYPVPAESVTYYSFDYGPVHVSVVDDMEDTGEGSAQREWLRADLRETDRTWTIVVMHKPAWGAGGGHGNHRPNQELTAEVLLPLGINLVLVGHNHHYARNTKDGLTHLTLGGGGAPLVGSRPNPAHGEVVVKTLHFVRLDADLDEMRVVAKDDDGKVIDEFTLPRAEDEHPAP